MRRAVDRARQGAQIAMLALDALEDDGMREDARAGLLMVRDELTKLEAISRELANVLGISVDATGSCILEVTDGLVTDGVQKFVEPYERLLTSIALRLHGHSR